MSEATVLTTGGKLEGAREGNLYVFRGVPYAAPPVGELRWMPPRPVKPWTGVRPAKEFGGACPQNEDDLRKVFGGTALPEKRSEDCLYLNIWTPGLDSARRPVLFWIHGGAFRFGAGSRSGYSGVNLARRGNAVIVTINHRLGPFGFLRLKEATGGGIPSTGNEGILDQAMALTWVRDNIAAFGGDPYNVTVFGCSAGGMSAGVLMAMPRAKGLLHKAILQSGFPNTINTHKRSLQTADGFLELSGANKINEGTLRALAVDHMLATEAQLARRFVPWHPFIDGEVVVEPPMESIKRGAADGIPVIAGSTRDEYKVFIGVDPVGMTDKDNLLRQVMYQMPAEHVQRVGMAYYEARTRRGEPAGNADILLAMLTDREFRTSAIRFCEAIQARHGHAYNYLFSWCSPALDGRLGACHTLDNGFIFGTYNESFGGKGPDAAALSVAMQDAWLAFARTGDPSTPGRPWPEYGVERSTMIFGKQSAAVKAPFDDERAAWDGVPDFVAE